MAEDKIRKKLAMKAIRGNTEAYGELIQYYKDYLYRTAMLSVKNEEIALDMVSECILNGFRSVHSLKNPEYFKTWITRVLRNTIVDYYRSERYNENLDEMQIAAEDSMVSSEEKLDLYQAIDLLSEKYKTVIILKYFDQLKISEIAYVMDIPEGSVKAYLNRAKADLRHLLVEEDIYEDGISGNTGTKGVRPGGGGKLRNDYYPTETTEFKIVGF